jgi:hypothetical protein
MTIKLPQPNLLDKLLRSLGKKRGVVIPIYSYDELGRFSYYFARKESLIKALFRSSKTDLPEGLIDIFEVSALCGSGGENGADT